MGLNITGTSGKDSKIDGPSNFNVKAQNDDPQTNEKAKNDNSQLNETGQINGSQINTKDKNYVSQIKEKVDGLIEIPQAITLDNTKHKVIRLVPQQKLNLERLQNRGEQRANESMLH